MIYVKELYPPHCQRSGSHYHLSEIHRLISDIKSICIVLRRVKRVKLFSLGVLQDTPRAPKVLTRKLKKKVKEVEE